MWELIIISDGSTDSTNDILDKYKDHEKIKVVKEPHKGRGSCIHQGHVLSNGDFCSLLDADDYLLPTTVEKVLEKLQDHPIIYTKYYKEDKKGKITEGNKFKYPYSSFDLLRKFMTFHFRAYKRELFFKCGGIDLEFNEAAADYDLCLKLSELEDFYFLKEFLYVYRINEQGISKNKFFKQAENSFRAAEKAIERRGLNYEIEPIFRLRLEAK